jgi:hypothetical protein
LSVSWRSSVRDIATAIPMLSGDTLLPLNTAMLHRRLQIRIHLDQLMQGKMAQKIRRIIHVLLSWMSLIAEELEIPYERQRKKCDTFFSLKNLIVFPAVNLYNFGRKKLGSGPGFTLGRLQHCNGITKV